MKNKPYFLALNRIEGIGPRTVMKLLSKWPSLEEMFKLSQADLEKAGLPQKLASAINSFNMKQVDDDFSWVKHDNRHLLSWEDENYPTLLKEIYDPPVILYAEGNLTALQCPKLAMVGTRKPSVTGKETAWHFAKALSSYGITIVSGLALGIDAAAHEGCLAKNGRTIAVMGTGIDRVYPRTHTSLAHRIKENGLILTEFSLKTSPTPGHFPRRNRIISGLSLATLVVEAAIKSGSLITARLALEQNRDVLATPGSIHNPQSKGCHQLLQQGAKLVTSVNDILEELNLQATTMSNQEMKQNLASGDENLVKCIGFEITSMDQILNRSGFTIEKIASDLANLEIQGIIKAVPGGYTRCVPP